MVPDDKDENLMQVGIARGLCSVEILPWVRTVACRILKNRKPAHAEQSTILKDTGIPPECTHNWNGERSEYS